MFQRHHNFFYPQRNFCPKNKKNQAVLHSANIFLNYTQKFFVHIANFTDNFL